MKTNLKVIKFTSILSVCLCFAIFLACLNVSYEWLAIKWLNEFLLAVFGGAFASMLVILICEIQKYFISKQEAEDKLYDCCLEILARFMSAKTTLVTIKQNRHQLSEGLLSALYQHGQYNMNLCFKIDYSTFHKKNKLYIAKENYIRFLVQTIEPTLRSCAFLDVAINEAQIANLQNKISANLVFANGNVLEIVNILIDKFEECINGTVEFMEKIDYSGRFKFKERFTNVQKNKEFFREVSVEEFVNQNKDNKEKV